MIAYPVTGLKVGNSPKQEIDVKEEEDIGKKNRMIVTPRPNGGERMIRLRIMVQEIKVK